MSYDRTLRCNKTLFRSIPTCLYFTDKNGKEHKFTSYPAGDDQIVRGNVYERDHSAFDFAKSYAVQYQSTSKTRAHYNRGDKFPSKYDVFLVNGKEYEVYHQLWWDSCGTGLSSRISAIHDMMDQAIKDEENERISKNSVATQTTENKTIQLTIGTQTEQEPCTKPEKFNFDMLQFKLDLEELVL